MCWTMETAPLSASYFTRNFPKITIWAFQICNIPLKHSFFSLLCAIIAFFKNVRCYFTSSNFQLVAKSFTSSTALLWLHSSTSVSFSWWRAPELNSGFKAPVLTAEGQSLPWSGCSHYFWHRPRCHWPSWPLGDRPAHVQLLSTSTPRSLSSRYPSSQVSVELSLCHCMGWLWPSSKTWYFRLLPTCLSQSHRKKRPSAVLSFLELGA